MTLNDQAAEQVRQQIDASAKKDHEHDVQQATLVDRLNKTQGALDEAQTDAWKYGALATATALVVGLLVGAAAF